MQASSTSFSPARGPAVTAVAPERTCTGRLGITRTTRASGSAAAIAETGTPAAIEITRRDPICGASAAMTSPSTWGLTARTTTSGSSARSAVPSA